MFALFIVSWRVYEAHRPVVSAGAATPSALAPATASPVPSPAPSPVRPSVKALPSPRPTSAFPIDLGQLNADQAGLERSEDALLIRIIATARNYLETVVLPAVKRAERVNSATSPAAAQSPAAIRKMP
jgi:hypothetical protein